MTQKEIETELVRVGNDFAIPLPLTFVEGDWSGVFFDPRFAPHSSHTETSGGASS